MPLTRNATTPPNAPFHLEAVRRPPAATVTLVYSRTSTTWVCAATNGCSSGSVSEKAEPLTAATRASSYWPSASPSSERAPASPAAGVTARPLLTSSITRSPAAKPIGTATERVVAPACTSAPRPVATMEIDWPLPTVSAP